MQSQNLNVINNKYITEDPLIIIINFKPQI